MVKLTKRIIHKLRSQGITTLHPPGFILPDDIIFEPPCSLKWMSIQHSLYLGAFSYAVSGFYFACHIGRYCSFGEQVQIGRHPHPLHWASTSPFFYIQYDKILDQQFPSNCDVVPSRDFKRNSPPVQLKNTYIGNDVWIGHGAFILPGVKIGHGAAIAAQSVVTHDVPPYAVVAGSPARVKRMRFPQEQVDALLDSQWWNFAPWQLKGARVDDINAFVDHVNMLNNEAEPFYSPTKVNLAELST